MPIKRFVHKGIEGLFADGRSRHIGPEYRRRLLVVLDALNGATCVDDLRNARGFHALTGDRSGTYAMSVSGNWRLTFRFEQNDKGDITNVNFEDYH